MITVCFPGLEVQVSEIPQPKSDGSSEPGFIKISKWETLIICHSFLEGLYNGIFIYPLMLGN